MAGDEGHLWVVQAVQHSGDQGADQKKDKDKGTDKGAGKGEAKSDADTGPTLVVRHRAASDEPNTLSVASSWSATVRPVGVAARGQSLWLVDADGVVQVISATRSPMGEGWTYNQWRRSTLPKGTGLRAFDVGGAAERSRC